MSKSIAAPIGARLADALEESFHFRYVYGGRTTYSPPYQRRWRVLPHAMLSHNTGGVFEVEFGDGRKERTPARGALLVPGGTAHRVRTVGRNPVTDHWLIFDFSVYGGIDLFSFIRMPAVLPARTGLRLGRICTALTALHQPGRPPSLGAAGRRLYQRHALLDSLMEHAAPLISDEGALRGLDRILPVLRHIDAHKAEAIGRGELGALVGLSPVRLHALFKAVMGLAPMAYVKRVRLREAQVRLVTSGLSVAEIGQAVGYGDPFHFSRLFKAAFGLSPLRYRQQIGRMG